MNPLLQASTLEYGAIPFNLIKSEHFIEAFEHYFHEAKKKIKEVKDAPVSFQNTVEGLEQAQEEVGRISGIFYTLYHAHAEKEYQELAEKIGPLLGEFSNDIFLDSELYLKIKEVEEPEHFEEKQLLSEYKKDFLGNGANLPIEEKEKLRKIDWDLSELSVRFGNNLLKATHEVFFIFTAEEVAGLPERVKSMAREEAKKREKEGYCITLDYPSVVPFLTYCQNRNLREKVFLSFNSRCISGEFENCSVLKKIIQNRVKKAKLLGHNNFADMILERQMAENSKSVITFLKDLLKKSMPSARSDYERVQKIFSNENDGPMKFWDYAYYAEKLKKIECEFDDEVLRPYFPLNHVLQGLFQILDKLYGLKFEEVVDLPVYHKDVRVYEVKDRDYLGLLYLDLFPRPEKNGGAWMMGMTSQRKGVRPHVSVVTNFSPATESTPSLLSIQEVTTLFHEMGHALHGLLSQCRYSSLSMTNVARDFVELPSQILENWVYEEEALSLLGKHYQTGEKIPHVLVEKLIKGLQFQEGRNTHRQLTFAFLDMTYHMIETSDWNESVQDFESNGLKFLEILPKEPGTLISSAFGHIFQGGYAAGYYGYKWAEVLDADAFTLFKEKGIFNSEVAKSFRENILEKGGSVDAMTLYKRFRGRGPDASALVKRAGLKEA